MRAAWTAIRLDDPAATGTKSSVARVTGKASVIFTDRRPLASCSAKDPQRRPNTEPFRRDSEYTLGGLCVDGREEMVCVRLCVYTFFIINKYINGETDAQLPSSMKVSHITFRRYKIQYARIRYNTHV